MSDAGTWRFKTMDRADLNIDPTQDEFFNTEALSSLNDGLLREVVQNALDARQKDGTSPVRLRFDLTGIDEPLCEDAAAKYLSGLTPHLTEGLSLPPPNLSAMPFMVIEDFSTVGLTGDPEQHEDAPRIGDAVDRNNFYYFWRNIGRSAKSERERGRWGLGKTVFPKSSRIKSFFGLTIRDQEPRTLLMGQAVLRTHKLGDDRQNPYGYYGVFEPDGFQLPIQQHGATGEFARDFGLARKDDAGLSIVVPYPRPEISAEDIVRSAILDFYVPILRCELEVEVVRGTDRWSLTLGNIRDVTRRIDWASRKTDTDSLLALFDFAEWAITILEDGGEVIRLAESSTSPQWSKDLFPDDALETLRNQFESGSELAFRVPVTIEPKGADSATSHFDVVIKRDEADDKGRSHFVREGLTITEVGAHNCTRNVCGIVFIDDKALSKMLGDSENVAHTDWTPRRTNLSDRYEKPERIIRFVKDSVVKLATLLSRPPEERDEELLQDILHYELEVEGGTGSAAGNRGGRRRRGRTTPVIVPPSPARRPSVFRVTKIVGGYRIAHNPETDFVRTRIRTRVAYHTRHGNPFSKYRPFDFVLGDSPIAVEVQGATVEHLHENELLFVAEQEGFEVKVVGFDEKRDIRVRTVLAGRLDDDDN